MSTHRRISVTDDVSGVSVVRFIDKKIVDSGSIEQLGEELNSLVNLLFACRNQGSFHHNATGPRFRSSQDGSRCNRSLQTLIEPGG